MRKDRKVKVKKTDGCTIYCVGISDKFRIKQISDNEFVVQKQFKETETTGYLWWKKTHTWNEWKRVTRNGQRLIVSRYYSNYQQLRSYKTLDKAIKWIYDFNKYPIYH